MLPEFGESIRETTTDKICKGLNASVLSPFLFFHYSKYALLHIKTTKTLTGITGLQFSPHCRTQTAIAASCQFQVKKKALPAEADKALIIDLFYNLMNNALSFVQPVDGSSLVFSCLVFSSPAERLAFQLTGSLSRPCHRCALCIRSLTSQVDIEYIRRV